MTILAGAFAVGDDWSPHVAAKALAAAACRYPDLHPRLLLDESHAVCYAVEPADIPAVVARGPGPEGSSALLVGQIADARGRSAEVLARRLATAPEALDDLGGRWIALRYDPAPRRLFVQSDRLGLAWLYLAPVPAGWLFSGDFGALVSALPSAPAVDVDTALTMLGVGYSPDERTCFRGITLLPPGEVIELDRGGPRRVRRVSVSYGDRHAGRSREDVFRELDGIFGRAVDDWCRAPDLLLSLSGGYDSRYGLALLDLHQIRARCFTFGHPGSPDARGARAVAAAVGRTTALFVPGTTSWPGWERCIQQVGVIGGFQWAGWGEEWLGRLRQGGRHAMLGFLGDALSGKHLVRSPETAGDWHDDWERWSLDEGWAGSALLRPDARRRLPEVVRERFDALAQRATFAFPHQRALHLDLYGRQRRFVAAQLNLMSRYLEPVPFFYTAETLDFWSNLPWSDLDRQSLYLAYARSRFAPLFPPPRGRSPARRLANASRSAAVRLWPGLRRMLAPPEIDRERIIGDHQRRIAALIHQAGPALEEILDLDAVRREFDRYPGRSTLNWVRLLRLVNVLMLTKLAWPGAHPET